MLRFLHVFQTLFIDFDIILSFWGLKMKADILVQRDGRDRAVRRPIFVYQHPFFQFLQIPLFAGKSKIDSSIKHSSFVMVSWETAWGKMCVTTVGSFEVLIEIVSLISVLHVKIHVFRKTLIFIFSVETNYSSLEDRYVRRLSS